MPPYFNFTGSTPPDWECNGFLQSSPSPLTSDIAPKLPLDPLNALRPRALTQWSL